MAQKLHFGFVENALRELGVEAFVLHHLQNLFQIFCMLGCVLTIHQNIVQINDHELINVRREDAIHHGLESRGGISQSHTEDFKLELSHGGSE